MNSYYKKIMITFVAFVLGTNSLWATQMEKCVNKGQRFDRAPDLLFGGSVKIPYCQVFCPSVGELEFSGNCDESWFCAGQYVNGKFGQLFGRNSFQKFHGKCPTKKQFDKYVADEEKKRKAEEEKKRKKEEAERKRRDKKNQDEVERKYNKLCSVEGNGSRGTMIDSRDGTEYATVQICSQIWMAENLYYEMDGSVCLDNKKSKCAKYGRYYIWYSAKSACPDGWRLPTAEDFRTLMWVAAWGVTADTLENGRISSTANQKAALKLMTSDFDGGLDTYGFAAIPTGYVRYPTRAHAREMAEFDASINNNDQIVCRSCYDASINNNLRMMNGTKTVPEEIDLGDYAQFITERRTTFWSSTEETRPDLYNPTKIDSTGSAIVLSLPIGGYGNGIESSRYKSNGDEFDAYPIRCIKDGE
ncbi:MAG: hypothetical protein IKJ76_09765 [Fibrobacter sp.]|nr:hypothetical protein [Fibrobacter sp.]